MHDLLVMQSAMLRHTPAWYQINCELQLYIANLTALSKCINWFHSS